MLAVMHYSMKRVRGVGCVAALATLLAAMTL